jgi:hypothetical protein
MLTVAAKRSETVAELGMRRTTIDSRHASGRQTLAGLFRGRSVIAAIIPRIQHVSRYAGAHCAIGAVALEVAPGAGSGTPAGASAYASAACARGLGITRATNSRTDTGYWQANAANTPSLSDPQKRLFGTWLARKSVAAEVGKQVIGPYPIMSWSCIMSRLDIRPDKAAPSRRDRPRRHGRGRQPLATQRDELQGPTGSAVGHPEKAERELRAALFRFLVRRSAIPALERWIS